MATRMPGRATGSTTQNPKAGYYLYDPKTGFLAKSELAVTMSGTLVVAIGQTDTSVQLFQTRLMGFVSW